MLLPLTVKDAIWLEREQARAAEDGGKIEEAKIKFMDSRFEALFWTLLDIREVVRHADYYQQVSALKEAGGKAKIEYYPDKNLPSVILSKRRREETMTPEEKAAQDEKAKRDLIARCLRAVAAGERPIDKDEDEE